MHLGPEQTIVLVAGQPPYVLDLTDKANAGRFDPNPFHTLR
jgi:hypothetical protein